ncbi:MAG TPA: hypothetical protein VKK79_15020, partial [Candidatus Lokiarchaeia archaeon]|nr:hypothetical protein [Candidatus Lokiarchaeia archaeon]
GITALKGIQLGCRVVAQDLNPVAWFMVKVALEFFDGGEATDAFTKLECGVAKKISSYYRTLCPACLKEYSRVQNRSEDEIEAEVCNRIAVGEDLNIIADFYRIQASPESSDKHSIFAEVIYYFWAKEVECGNCSRPVPLFKGYMFAHKRHSRKTVGYYVWCPGCGEVFIIPNIDQEVTCPSCHLSFHSRKGTVTRNGSKYLCPDPACNTKESIVDWIRHHGKPVEKIYAVQYYCPRCKKKEYIRARSIDRALFARAERDLAESIPTILGAYIPDTDIPAGFNTKQAMNHGYLRWRDMFNARQLLALSTLLRGIMELDCTEGTRNFLLLSFSKSLEYSNMLCEYHRVNNYVYNLFKTHAFHPPLLPVESNSWGAQYGFGTFQNLFASNLKHKEYNVHPYVKYVDESGEIRKFYASRPLDGHLGNIFEDPTANAWILNGDSTTLTVPDHSVDAVITDPPYFDNVMYSELSEFFYAWLRLALNKSYPSFYPPHVPNESEIIVNSGQGKTEADYLQRLTLVFGEIKRTLKAEGILVFTFHHQVERAWGVVLQSIIDGGFFISVTYPVLSEMSTAVPILNKINPQCDIIVVCHQRSEAPSPHQWEDLQLEMVTAVRESVDHLVQGGNVVSREDLLVIAAGKCLEHYSKHFPEVYNHGELVTISEALKAIQRVADASIL